MSDVEINIQTTGAERAKAELNSVGSAAEKAQEKAYQKMQGVSTAAGTRGGAAAQAATKQIGYVQTAASEFSSKVGGKLIGMFSAVAVGAMVFDKIGEAISKNLATAKQVSSLASKFHIDPKEVHSLMMAANDAGVAVRTLLQGMKTLGGYAGKALIDKDKASILTQIGIDATKIAQVADKPAKYLGEIAKGLMEIDNEQDRTRVGTALLGRQYQQMLPLIEKLGTDARARAEYLDNENAMTKEQVEENKEIARMQSVMNQQWEKLIANLTPMIVGLTAVLALVFDINKWLWQAAEAMTRIGDEAKADAKENLGNKVSVLMKAAEDGNLTKEQVVSLRKAKNAGKTVAAWATEEAIKAREEETGEETPTSWKEDLGVFDPNAVKWRTQQNAENAEHETRKEVEKRKVQIAYAKKAAILEDAAKHDEAFRAKEAAMQAKAFAADEKESKETGKEVFTNRQALYVGKEERHAAHRQTQASMKSNAEGVFTNVMNGMQHDVDPMAGIESASSRMKSKTQKDREEYDKDFTAFINRWARTSGKAREDLATLLNSLPGIEVYYDAESGEIMKGKKPVDAATKMKRTHIGRDTKVVETERKEYEKMEKDEARMEKHAKNHLKGVAKAEEELSEYREDAVTATDKYKPLKEKADVAKQAVEDRAKEKDFYIKEHDRIQKLYNEGGSFENGKRVEQKDVDAIYAKREKAVTDYYSAEADKKKTVKEASDANKERLKALDAVTTKEEALAAARQEAWMKEKKAQDDLYKDALDYEKELLEHKYNNMKQSGSSEQEILEEKFTDSVEAYQKAFEHAESENAAVDERLAQRQREADEQAELDGETHGEVVVETEEEKAIRKKAREGVDAARQGATGALNAIGNNWKPGQAVVSDLGKIGMGRAVQFGGQNPVDEIKKSNKWLELIYRDKTTKDSFAGSNAVDTFGQTDSQGDWSAEAIYSPSSPVR